MGCSMEIQFIKIDSTVNDRASKWAIACPTCQYEREVSYCQIWNVKKGKSTGDCTVCASSKRDKDLSGLKLGRKYWPRETKANHTKNKVQFDIMHTFGVEVGEETRAKMSSAKFGKRGEGTNGWKGGITDDRRSSKYSDFRMEILNRDDFTCQICDVRGGKLHIDHIKQWCNYPELRFEPSNCRTLCIPCHRETDTWGRNKKKGE